MACQISPIRFSSALQIRTVCHSSCYVAGDMQGTLLHMPGNGDIGMVIAIVFVDNDQDQPLPSALF